ncbi:MAG: hypothetical protein QM778_32275 [Myxococcales bacterium]
MATFHQQRAPGDYRVERHEGHRAGASIWRWLIPLALGLLALWGLFGRRNHQPTMMDSTEREPARMPYNGR